MLKKVKVTADDFEDWLRERGYAKMMGEENLRLYLSKGMAGLFFSNSNLLMSCLFTKLGIPSDRVEIPGFCMRTRVYVLRIGHRPERDKRVSTHVALTARAFGACGIYFDVEDSKLFESIEDVCNRWGRDNGFCEFFVERCSWKSLIKNFDGLRVHLTMYGIPLTEKLEEIARLQL